MTSVHERRKKRAKKGRRKAPEADGAVDAGSSGTVVATALHLFSEVFA